MNIMKLIATAVMVVTLPAACPQPSEGNRDPASDANGQCATRPIQIAPVAYEAAPPDKVTYSFVASVLTEECKLTGMHGPTMIVNVIMRQSDINGKNKPVGVNVVDREERSPYVFTWGMDRGWVHEIQGDARITMTAGQIDDTSAGFIECYLLRNGTPFPAAAAKDVKFRDIAPIRAGQESVVECHGNIPPD